MKKKKIIVFLLIIIFILAILSPVIFALHPTDVLIGDSVDGEQEIMKFGNKAITIIQVIGAVSSVIILMICGLKYMLGSVEEKSGYKKSMLPFLIGAVMLFSGTTIPSIVYDFAGGGQGLTSSFKRQYMSFCPKGHKVELVIHAILPDDPVSEIEDTYLCTNESCFFSTRELSKDSIHHGYGCPRCNIKLNGNYCESCKKYYE